MRMNIKPFDVTQVTHKRKEIEAERRAWRDRETKAYLAAKAEKSARLAAKAKNAAEEARIAALPIYKRVIFLGKQFLELIRY